MAVRVKVLFLCIGNSCRSQIAEAIAKQLASDVIEPSSAGLLPFGKIMEPTTQVLKERGISMEGQYSKPLRPSELAAADLVINMTGHRGARMLQDPKPPVEDWDIADPFGFNLTVYRKIRDEIEARVRDLALRLRARRESQKTAQDAGPHSAARIRRDDDPRRRQTARFHLGKPATTRVLVRALPR